MHNAPVQFKILFYGNEYIIHVAKVQTGILSFKGCKDVIYKLLKGMGWIG